VQQQPQQVWLGVVKARLMGSSTGAVLRGDWWACWHQHHLERLHQEAHHQLHYQAVLLPLLCGQHQIQVIEGKQVPQNCDWQLGL
jgi:hypothetical protein